MDEPSFTQDHCTLVPYRAGGALNAGRKAGCSVFVAGHELIILSGGDVVDRAPVPGIRIDTPAVQRALGRAVKPGERHAARGDTTSVIPPAVLEWAERAVPRARVTGCTTNPLTGGAVVRRVERMTLQLAGGREPLITPLAPGSALARGRR